MQSTVPLDFTPLQAQKPTLAQPLENTVGPEDIPLLLKQAENLAQIKNYAAAHAIYLKLSKLGVSEADYRLGRIYKDGFGIGLAGYIDLTKSMQYFASAYQQGHIRATYELGIMNYYICQDYEAAHSFFFLTTEPSSNQHYLPVAELADARFHLGELYSTGFCGARWKNLDLGVYYYCTAAQLDHIESHYRLADHFEAQNNFVLANKHLMIAKELAEQRAEQRDGKPTSCPNISTNSSQLEPKSKNELLSEAMQQLQLNQADDCHQLREYDKAVSIYLDLAQINNAEAHYRLGLLYRHGCGPQLLYLDCSKAAEQFGIAHGLGHLRATYQLGLLNYDGYDDAANLKVQCYTTAYLCFSKVAEQCVSQDPELRLEHADAKFCLGKMFFNGEIPDRKDIATAIYYFTEAAQLGHVGAHNRLGYIFYNGYKTEKNELAAHKHLAFAANNGHSEAMFNLGHMCDMSYRATGNFSYLHQAISIYHNASQKNHPQAMRCLAAIYLGIPATGSAQKAIELYQTAAKLDDTESIYQLAVMCYHGHHVIKNLAAALTLFLRASGNGHNNSRYWLAVMYERGEGTPQDLAKAAIYYCSAAHHGHKIAALCAGKFLYEGKVVDQDYATARKYLMIAHGHGYKEAAPLLAEMYQLGRGVDPDPVLAEKYRNEVLGPRIKGPYFSEVH